jgi:threonine dehydratase
MSLKVLTPQDIISAHNRIKDYIVKTPILMSRHLDNLLGHKIYFKYEGAQVTGSFKARGALNALLSLKEQNKLPDYVVTFSSGNHAQAVALAGQKLGVKVKVFFQPNPIAKKLKTTQEFGAETFVAETRQQAEMLTMQEVEKGTFFLPPFDNDDIICGQGTSCHEALSDLGSVDAIFATCGGGGWLSGTYLAAQGLCPTAQIIGCEPLLGNDATQSYRTGKIVALSQAPNTIADGARTLKVAERTFQYLQKLNDFFEISEEDIIKYHAISQEHLKVVIEPTSAVAFAGLVAWLEKNKPQTEQKLLVLLSGSNV